MQNLICCIIVAILSLFRAVTVEKLSWNLIRIWLPVNVIFVGMLVSGMYRYGVTVSGVHSTEYSLCSRIRESILNGYLFFWCHFSLKYINVAMVTILKNVTNILTAVGELYIFRKRQNQKVWIAMFMMVMLYLLWHVTEKPNACNLFQNLLFWWSLTLIMRYCKVLCIWIE